MHWLRALAGAYALAIATLIVANVVGLLIVSGTEVVDVAFGPYHGLIMIGLTIMWFVVIRNRIA